MVKIIVNATHKGGEGKTTNTVMLAEYCSIVLKKRTLLIDLDPQANLSGRYIDMIYDPAYKGGFMPPLHPDFDPTEKILCADRKTIWDCRSSIGGIFYGEPVAPYETSIPNLDIIPAYSSKLQGAEEVRRSEVANKVHEHLKKFLSHEDISKEYDVVVIDTAPSKGPLTISAIKAASHMLIPAKMEKFSIDGILGMLQLWKQETYCRPPERPLNLVGILVNQYKGTNLHKSFMKGLQEKKNTAQYVLPHIIKQRSIYSEIMAMEKPNSLFCYEKDVGKLEYESACKFIMESVLNG